MAKATTTDNIKTAGGGGEIYEVDILLHDKFMQAKAGNCPYRDRCPRYARTIEKRNKQSN